MNRDAFNFVDTRVYYIVCCLLIAFDICYRSANNSILVYTISIVTVISVLVILIFVDVARIF